MWKAFYKEETLVLQVNLCPLLKKMNSLLLIEMLKNLIDSCPNSPLPIEKHSTGMSKKKVYIIEYLPEWVTDGNFNIKQEFRKQLKSLIDGSSIFIKYVLMSNNPNEQLVFPLLTIDLITI